MVEANQLSLVHPALLGASQQQTVSARALDQKLRHDLIHPLMTKGLAQVFTIGQKHGRNNWLEHPMTWGDQIAAHGRHLTAFLSGEVRCPIDGQFHLDSAAWRLLTLSVYYQLGLGQNDLPGWMVHGTPARVESVNVATPARVEERTTPIPDWLTPGGHGGRVVH